MELNEKEINQLEKFKEKLEKSETKKRGRKKKIEEDKQMKVEKATEIEKAVQEVEAEKPVEAVENEKISDKLKSQLEFRLIYWNDMQKEFDHLEYRIYKGIKKELDEVKEMQKKILSVLGYGNDVFNSNSNDMQEKIKKMLGKQ